MLAIASNSLPSFFKEMCITSHYLIGFTARYNYFRYGTFNLNRVIYYVFQVTNLSSISLSNLYRKTNPD